MLDRRTFLASSLGFAAQSVLAQGASEAQAFPSGRITLMVGFGAGGMTDVSSRILASVMEKALKTPVIVENRGGAGGILAINAVRQMPADGHTMVSFLTDAPFTASFQGKPINLDDWALIGGYMPQERVLFAVKDAPFNTAQEMMAYAKTNPLTMSDGGSFWSARVMEAFAKKHGLQIAVMAQRSGQAASTDLMGGHVSLAETGTGTPAWTAAKQGELKILATLTPGGLAAFGMPHVPTFEQLGADYVSRQYYGYAIRSATPGDRIEKLRAMLSEIMSDSAVRAQFAAIDLTPGWMDAKGYEALLQSVARDGEAMRKYLNS